MGPSKSQSTNQTKPLVLLPIPHLFFLLLLLCLSNNVVQAYVTRPSNHHYHRCPITITTTHPHAVLPPSVRMFQRLGGVPILPTREEEEEGRGKRGCFMSLNDDNDKVDESNDENEPSSITPPNVSSSTTNTNTNPPPPPAPILPSTQTLMKALNTSPRRIFLSLSTTTFLALGSNFLGCTSTLLSRFSPSTIEQTGLDRIYPIGQYRRFRSVEGGYSFLVPKDWVGDPAIEVAKAVSRSKPLDYSMASGGRATGGGGVGGSSSSSRRSIPDAAFGPPNQFNERGISSSDTNVSILLTPVPRGFDLSSVMGGGIGGEGGEGGPSSSTKDAAEYLLQTSIAPVGSGRKGTLLDAVEVVQTDSSAGGRDSTVVYQLEYRVERERSKGLEPLRAMSVVAVTGGMVEGVGSVGGSSSTSTSSGIMETRGNQLVTLTVVAPEKDWELEEMKAEEDGGSRFRTMVESFKVLR